MNIQSGNGLKKFTGNGTKFTEQKHTHKYTYIHTFIHLGNIGKKMKQS